MATDREQLIEMRRSVALSTLEGESQRVIDRATRDLERMNFEDHQDFLGWVSQLKGTSDNTPATEATEEELDELFNHMGLGPVNKRPKDGEASQDELDELFKHMRI